MDLELLRTYKAIAETGSTIGAAERLGLSQSAVSRRLAQLEQVLNLPLFLRDRGRLIPTRESRHIEAQMLLLVDQGDRLAARAAELRSGNAAQIALRVAVPISLMQSLIPQILTEFLAKHDRVQVELHFGAYDTIERMLIDERAEIGFLRMPIQRPGLRSLPVIKAPTVVVMPHDHPLAAKPVVSPQELSRVPLILLGRMRAPRREIDELFFDKGLRPNVRLEVHSVMAACALAAQGLGVTLVNGLMAEDFRHLPIAIRPLNEAIVHRFAFATNEAMPMSAAAEAFIAIASRHLHAALKRGGGGAGQGARQGARQGAGDAGASQA
ncbi:LysR family transcriptional regulator [Paracoccus pacificus]|uniref:LysR family transcriptional regulator n=1 Tax=Paracoccus pacificus TaxID=1463598 RepID=A0ABW4R6V1_9RHOB